MNKANLIRQIISLLQPGDSIDEGLEIRKSVRERLIRQQEAVAAGERGEPFEDVIQRLELDADERR